MELPDEYFHGLLETRVRVVVVLLVHFDEMPARRQRGDDEHGVGQETVGPVEGPMEMSLAGFHCGIRSGVTSWLTVAMGTRSEKPESWRESPRRDMPS